MRKMLRQVLIVVSATSFSLFAIMGCNQKPVVTEIFTTQLLKFLEEGAKINAMTGQGVSYLELRNQLALTKAAYDMLKTIWPSSLSQDMVKDFDRAVYAWDTSLELWALKIEGKENPGETDIRDWKKLISEFENDLVVKVRDVDLFAGYPGTRYLPVNVNISILFTVAGNSFNRGRAKILEEVK